MLNLRTDTELWSSELRPIGDGFDKESFDNWWARNAANLKHLHVQIAEQWVYRHWQYTDYQGVPLAQLTWSRACWSTERILTDVRVAGNELDPQFDMGVFTDSDTATGHPFLTTGTWDYPIVVLHTPSGVRMWGGDFPDTRYLLIEGHQRMRLLNAFSALQKEMQPVHDVFLLGLS